MLYHVTVFYHTRPQLVLKLKDLKASHQTIAVGLTSIEVNACFCFLFVFCFFITKRKKNKKQKQKQKQKKYKTKTKSNKKKKQTNKQIDSVFSNLIYIYQFINLMYICPSIKARIHIHYGY